MASTMDLLAILHSHKIAHNVTVPSVSQKKKKKEEEEEEKKKKEITDLPFTRILCRVTRIVSIFCVRNLFAPSFVAQRRRTGRTTEVHSVLVSLQGRRS